VKHRRSPTPRSDRLGSSGARTANRTSP
jgi:hypothetical protein